jgi:hypothetical protein
LIAKQATSAHALCGFIDELVAAALTRDVCSGKIGSMLVRAHDLRSNELSASLDKGAAQTKADDSTATVIASRTARVSQVGWLDRQRRPMAESTAHWQRMGFRESFVYKSGREGTAFFFSILGIVGKNLWSKINDFTVSWGGGETPLKIPIRNRQTTSDATSSHRHVRAV